MEVQTPTNNYGITHTDGTTRLNTYINSFLGGAGGIGTQSNHSLFFYAGNYPQMLLDTSGRLGIGALTPQACLHVNGTSWFQGDTTPLPNSAGKGIAVGFPSTGNAGYIYAFDYGTLTGKDLLLNSNGGNVGIGTTTPLTRLQVKTGTGLYGFTHTDGTITVGSYVGGGSSGASGGWLGTQSNHKLFFFTNNGQPSMTIDTTGNVGIGTTAPTSKVEIAAQDGLAITGYQPFLTLRDTNSANKRSVVQSADGTIIFLPDINTSSVPTLVIRDNSNVGIGLVKAMALVGQSNTIVRCYNSTLTGSAATTPPCGFQNRMTASGNRQIDFGFQVDNRFVSVTPNQVAGSTASFLIAIGVPTSIIVPTTPSDAPFMIFIY